MEVIGETREDYWIPRSYNDRKDSKYGSEKGTVMELYQQSFMQMNESLRIKSLWMMKVMKLSITDMAFLSKGMECGVVESLLASTVVARWPCIRLVGRSSPRLGPWCLSCLLGRNCCGRAPQWCSGDPWL